MDDDGQIWREAALGAIGFLQVIAIVILSYIVGQLKSMNKQVNTNTVRLAEHEIRIVTLEKHRPEKHSIA